MTIAIADLLRPVTAGELIAAGVHPFKVGPIVAFHAALLDLARASFANEWCTCNDHDNPAPCRCEKASER